MHGIVLLQIVRSPYYVFMRVHNLMSGKHAI